MLRRMRLAARLAALLAWPLAALAAAAQAPAPPLLLQTPIVAGRLPIEAQGVLGLAESCAPQPNGSVRCFYSGGRVRITYINQRADRIEVRVPGGIAADATALGALGLPQLEPTERRADRIAWTNVPGYREVALVANDGSGNPGFIVKWRTP